MMLVNMLLNSIGFKPKTTTQATLGIIIPVALVITTFVFVEYFVTASIIIAIAFPLFLWFYASFNTVSNSLVKLWEDRKASKAFNNSRAVPAGT